MRRQYHTRVNHEKEGRDSDILRGTSRNENGKGCGSNLDRMKQQTYNDCVVALYHGLYPDKTETVLTGIIRLKH